MKIKVLLAEDEDALQKLVEEVLSDAGFEVVIAGNGAQAIGRLDFEAPRFGAIITDINLGPGPDGWAVGQHARGLVANIPVIYVSGHGMKDWPSKGVPDSAFLAKPFKLRQIVAVVSTLLAKQRGLTEAEFGVVPDHAGHR